MAKNKSSLKITLHPNSKVSIYMSYGAFKSIINELKIKFPEVKISHDKKGESVSTTFTTGDVKDISEHFPWLLALLGMGSSGIEHKDLNPDSEIKLSL